MERYLVNSSQKTISSFVIKYIRTFIRTILDKRQQRISLRKDYTMNPKQFTQSSEKIFVYARKDNLVISSNKKLF